MSYSKTIFFIPVWFDDYERFCTLLKADGKWEDKNPKEINNKTVEPAYLFHYASDMMKNASLFSLYSLKPNEIPDVYMFDKEEKTKFKGTRTLEEVRFSCFSTGVGFMEFHISYSGMTIEEIENFAYLFKKAVIQNKKIENQLYTVAEELLPKEKNTERKLFFTSSYPKYECNCMHLIHVDEEIPEGTALNDTLLRLCRSYNTSIPAFSEDNYDMIYEAGRGDYWSGSTDGLANIVYDCNPEKNECQDEYLHKRKPKHLAVDYYFLYLLLLNQKYSALQYIHILSNTLNKSTKEIESLNKRIIQLKNAFSFNVISDDRHYQNVYSKMFEILEIKNLLADLIENENQIGFLQDAKHASADRTSNKYLLGISIFSLFSALIDSATYFDRFKTFEPFSTVLSIIVVVIIFIFCVALAINSTKK